MYKVVISSWNTHAHTRDIFQTQSNNKADHFIEITWYDICESIHTVPPPDCHNISLPVSCQACGASVFVNNMTYGCEYSCDCAVDMIIKISFWVFCCLCRWLSLACVIQEIQAGFPLTLDTYQFGRICWHYRLTLHNHISPIVNKKKDQNQLRLSDICDVHLFRKRTALHVENWLWAWIKYAVASCLVLSLCCIQKRYNTSVFPLVTFRRGGRPKSLAPRQKKKKKNDKRKHNVLWSVI